MSALCIIFRYSYSITHVRLSVYKTIFAIFLAHARYTYVSPFYSNFKIFLSTHGPSLKLTCTLRQRRARVTK